jgi:hypothetical protein
VNRFSGFLGAASALVISFAACGGKVVVDASDTGGAGGESNTISTADVASSSVTTASGGPCDPAYTCAQAITPPDVDPGKLCEGSSSAALHDALIQCACVERCPIECGNTACVGIDGSASCKACIQDPGFGCLPQLEACVDDL